MSEKRKIFFGIGIILFLIIGIFLVSSIENNEDNNLKVSREVYSAFESNSKNVRVIINLKQPIQEKDNSIKGAKSLMITQNEKEDIKENVLNNLDEKKIKHVFDNSIAIEVDESELENLRNNPNVESVIIDKPVHAFLQNSVPLINVTSVWPIQISGINLTGMNETICIIDTGINKYHADFQNRVIAEYCYCTTSEGVSANCCPDGTSEDNNATDNNGHGTHVAGIAGASGGINGVAINVNIIMIKALNSSGNGFDTDIKAGIDWCVNNASLYNISVISMSLGGGSYTGYCDGGNSLTSSINSAIAKNISVIAASGNEASITAISSPACIQNVTAVGWSDKLTDTLNNGGNRNNLIDLVAPGTSINSTYLTGYTQFSGTSMATPHVAGAFALIRQLYRLQEGRDATPSEIQNLFNSTGKQINDSGGTNLNFSRIDVYAAVNSILKRVSVSFISPLNNSHFNLTNQNQTFVCNSTSINSNLTNMTFYLWNSTNNLIYNLTTNISGTNNQSTFYYNFTIENNYLWNCIAYNNNNLSSSNTNYTITYDVTKPQINLISPTNSTTETSSSTVSFTYNVSDVSIANCSLIINNAVNETDNSVSVNITQTFSKSLSNANYNWSINCTDSAGNINSSEERTFTLSYTAPAADAGSPGGGGGGGGASIKSMIYIPSVSETFSGYTKSLSKDDKIKFTFFSAGSETHTLTINQIGTNYVNLTIQSNPINLKLGIGQSAKLNLTNSDYYDLYVKLNAITANKADITIQTINEAIRTSSIVNNETMNKEIEENKNTNQIINISNKERFIYAIGLIIIIIAVIILVRKKDDYSERVKNKYKQEFKKHIKPLHKLK